MKAIAIQFVQRFPATAAVSFKRLGKWLSGKSQQPPVRLLEDIDHFPTEVPKPRRALLAFAPLAWLTALDQAPDIRLFNYYGLVYNIVRALNTKGFLVDIVDFNVEHVVTKPYDLFIGHGGSCRTILDSLAPETPVLNYVSGAHWRAFETETAERYAYFKESTNSKWLSPVRRSFNDGDHVGEDYLCERSTALFTIRCPRMVAAYPEPLREKFVFTGLGAYLDERLSLASNDRDYDAGRRYFCYVGGTGGNIQKGLNLLLEAFARTPQLHLLIFCRVEPEILDHYRALIELPNIHYIYHLRAWPFRWRLTQMVRNCNFSIHAPINVGLGTAFMASLGTGMIPVGYIDYAGSPESAVLADSWQVDALVECIERASSKSVEWCEAASRGARDFHRENCTEEGFFTRFSALVEKVSPGK